MPDDRTHTNVRPLTVRSAVSNGRRQFVTGGDGRGPWARRHRDLVELHADDLGGNEVLTEAQMSLIRRAATIEVELEGMEAKLSEGEQVNLDAYGRISGQLRRILETLGIGRVKRDRLPTLEQLIAQEAVR